MKRQVAPADIQSQVRWFDGGASGEPMPTRCDEIDVKDIPGIHVIASKDWGNDLITDQQGNQVLPRDYVDRPLYEGAEARICAVFESAPQSRITWEITYPDGRSVRNETDAQVLGTRAFAEFTPLPRFTHGHYRVTAVGDGRSLHAEFDILPAREPGLWTEGQLEPGRAITVYYAGFEPGEVITTVWYSNLLAWKSEEWGSGPDAYHAEYLTSWQTTADNTGHAVTYVSVPKEATCVPVYSILATIDHSDLNKEWWILGVGFGLDMAATNMQEIIAEGPTCAPESGPSVMDNSSRFLSQVFKGLIHDGETKSDTLGSTHEAHNWTYEAEAGRRFSVQLEFLHNNYPIQRISIIDPSGNLVYECSNVVYGCSAVSTPEIEYSPATSGSYTIRVDMFGDGDGTYELSVKSGQDQEATAQSEIVIDDSSRDVELGGPQNGWRTAPYGYSGSTHWTYCTNQGTSNWAKWIPDLSTGGNYEVFVYVPEHKAGTIRAQYHVFHNGADDMAVVAQSDYSNQWVSIGIYRFAADGTEYVYLDDNTGEPRNKDITIAFDAVKFVNVP